MTLKKRPLIWLVLTAMIFSLFPPGLFGSNVASAASQAPATYFIPDLKSISDTSLLSTEPSTANSTQISRGNVYMTTSPNLTITGTFSYVSKDTMRVKVEQLSSEAVGNQGQVRWITDDTHFTSGAVTTDANASNKFTATNLNLFSGFNKITFYGNQGNVERSDTFYVLYDKVPFVEDLKVFSGNNAFNLNEGAQVVVNTQAVAVQGKAQNATKVTVSVNGGTALLSSLLEDGTFFTPQMNLSSGLNNLKFSITNASDTINIERSVYYFDTNQPFSKLDVVSDTETKSLLGSTQTVSTPGNPAGTAFLNGEVLLPYNASNQDFATTAQMTINTTAVNFTVLSNTVVAGNDGVTPAYRLVTFTTDNYNLQTDPNGIKNDQAANLVLTYGTFSAAYNGVFKYLPGDTVITNMYLLPDYKNNTFSSKVPLNNSQVDKDSFYILVAANKAPTTTLEAHYLPLGTNPLSIVPVTPTTTIGANEQVYHVTNFASGQQQVRFKYNNASSSFNANISFVSKSYIYVSNLFDGQTYSFDSRTTHNLDVDGQYIGFTDLNNSMFNAQVFVNGVDQKPGDTSWITKSTGAFKLSFEIKKDGPLVFGENTIVLTGTDKDASGGTKEIRKELRIYILDTNVSNIDRFMPTLIPTNQRQAFSEKEVKNYTADQMSRIFSVTPDFAFQTDRYVTSEQEYDLVFKGGGAQIVNLYFGSKVILTYNPPAKGSETNGTASDPQSGYKYDFAGNEDEFIIRVQDLKFDAPGSHVYTLELINSTGARTTQRLEIVREPSSYRILAPQPTVGDKIVVNKNFVRFDIEAEGASQVIIDKKPAVKRTDLKDRFVYDYVGLKPNKNNAIKIQVVREGNTINDVINVFYTGTVEVDSQFMAPGPANKYSVFNKQLELSFPKGTILQSSSQVGSGVVKFYPENKLLFGIADPKDGVVERRNDYGNIINVNPDSRTEGGLSTIIIPDTLVLYFNSTLNTSNFSPVSDIYWINGGVGELGDQGSTGYKPGTNGLAPYSIEGNFTQYQAERKLVPSQRGTLKLTYDSNIVDEVGSTITVFRYTDKGVWQNIGGEVDTKKHTISVPFDEFGYYKVMKQSKGYSDVTNHPWGRNLLNALYSKGVMNSIRFNEFGADDQTTRGEFATLLVKGLSLPLNYDNKQTFYDIVPGAQSSTWDYASIETAARAGIVQGLSDGFFGADQRVTREQAAVMIARAMSLKLSANNDKLSANLGKSFMDAASIDFYARPAIEAVNKAKIMQGSPVTIAGAKKPLVQFNPKGNLTRAEAAKIAVELLKKTTKLFPKNLS
ncbi:MAG: S-layer homology domain-containing protein [Paenibacillus sp.]|uniref:S-layer homology domain-containing protein n=1 Tax=Paenibacillus sp. TaxID=58172 RepID=UPI0025E68DF4|nr:S-layer homology domain-containing protein [Paenibacillus sp.]MBR2565055.1 S-layer homology domain-containing protein [Paenibacillus sp.]